MSLTWYFFLAVGFLIVVIMSVPDDERPVAPDAPEASQSLLVPSGAFATALPLTGRTC